MVECLTWDKGAVGLSLSGGTISFTCARHVILYLVLVQTRKRPDMTEHFLTGMGGSRVGDKGSGPPWKITKIGFLSNTGPDPLKNCKATTRPKFNVKPSLGRQRNPIKMAFCWRADDSPLLVVFWSSLLSSTKKNLSKLDPLSAWLRCKVLTQIIEVHSCSVLVF